MARLVKNLPAMWRPEYYSWVGKIPWRKERLPTPVFWPGEFHGVYSPWGRKELNTSDFHFHFHFSLRGDVFKDGKIGLQSGSSEFKAQQISPWTRYFPTLGLSCSICKLG